MNISGHTKPFAVLGHPVEHSLSPLMHNAALEALGRDAVYLAFDVRPEDLMGVLASMGKMGFAGVNLTVPHKEVAFAALDKLDESAALLRAVNTVHFTDAGLVGHNTDGYGIIQAVKEAFALELKDRKVCIVGTGGAGRASALISGKEGAAEVLLVNRTPERAETVAGKVAALSPHTRVRRLDLGADGYAAIREADLVINATTVGMKPTDPPLLPEAAFRPGQKVLDLIYVCPETAFLKPAVAAGADDNGLGMLLHQGVKAMEIWTGTVPPADVMRQALEKAVYTS